MAIINKKLFAFLLVPALFFLFSMGKVSAQDPCAVEERLYGNNLLNCMKGIALTGCDFTAAMAASAYSTVSGYGLTETVGCSSYFLEHMNVADSDYNFGECSGTDVSVCAEMTNTANDDTGSRGSWLAQFQKRRVAGSLLGFAYLTETFTQKEPLPANLAFYVNDAVSRVPYVGGVLAQDTDYRHSLINSIFVVWKVFRNFAYAFIALVLLYTGIIIILRRKINSQVVVSVQYALPRIVLAIFLITFSYPIGATMGSLGWTLFKSNFALAGTLFSDIEAASATEMWLVLVPMYPLIISGLNWLIAVIIILVIFLIAGIIFNVKAIIIYMKILFSILTAPIEFALGAVPGNDDKIKNWFLRMAKYILTLLLMGLILPLGVIISVLLIQGLTTSSTSEVGGAVGVATVMFGYIVPVFIVLYCFGLGIGMEKKMEDFLGLGQKKR